MKLFTVSALPTTAAGSVGIPVNIFSLREFVTALQNLIDVGVGVAIILYNAFLYSCVYVKDFYKWTILLFQCLFFASADCEFHLFSLLYMSLRCDTSNYKCRASRLVTA
jgi:hypothetical protein